jgi:circadian clock protein KaiB
MKRSIAARAKTTSAAMQRAAHELRRSPYVLRLYVAGMTPRSTRAIENIRKICREHLEGRYDLQVIDIYQQPTLAGGEQIIAAPTLVKKLPVPLRRFIGDMSQTERILVGLDVRARAREQAAPKGGPRKRKGS